MPLLRERNLNKLVHANKQLKSEKLSDYIAETDSVSESKVSTLSLEEYRLSRNRYCQLHHSGKVCDCQSMLSAADTVLREGICSLSYVYRTAFPHLQYQPTQAKRRILQLPLAAI